MLNKIGSFLMMMLAICGALLLMATASRAPQPVATEPTVQTTAGEMTEPALAETVPEETIPETLTGETIPEEPQTIDRVREQVAQILDREKLETTQTTRLASSTGLGADEATVGLCAYSHGRALAQELSARAVNPIAAHWELVYEGLYEKQKDGSGKLKVSALKTPEQAAKTYEYTVTGARQLLTQLLALAAQMDDGLELEMALLGANMAVEPEQVFYSQEEECRYAYFTCTTDRVTYILCFYLRGDALIEDVELQLLTMRHASGSPEALAELDARTERQAAALMAAAELLMTGSTRAGEGDVPFTYDVGGWSAKLERFAFTGDPDQGYLVNYRLKK